MVHIIWSVGNDLRGTREASFTGFVSNCEYSINLPYDPYGLGAKSTHNCDCVQPEKGVICYVYTTISAHLLGAKFIAFTHSNSSEREALVQWQGERARASFVECTSVCVTLGWPMHSHAQK